MKQLTLDYNPMRSPPATLLGEDLDTVLQYCRIRQERFKEVPRTQKHRKSNHAFCFSSTLMAVNSVPIMNVVAPVCSLWAPPSQVEKLLAHYGFEINLTHFSPFTKDALVGNTGMLTADDLRAFDMSLDDYLNGPFYDSLTTSTVLIDKLDHLRHERQYVATSKSQKKSGSLPIF